MEETITLDTRKCYSTVVKQHLAPLRRGERGNVKLTVAVRRDRMPYDLAGMTAHLVWLDSDDKLVGPVPMDVADPAAGTVCCTLPDACYSAVGTARAYVELRRGAELVDTTDDVLVDVLDCIDADSEQAEEYKPLIGEVRDATDAAVKAAKRAESGEDERVAAEAERVAAESARNQAETERVAEEKARAVAEQRRVTAETDRERDFAKSKAAADTAAGKANAAAAKAAADTKTAIADAGAKVDAAVDRVNDAANQAVTKAEAATATADAANVAAGKAVTDAQASIAEVKATEAKLYPVAENVLVGSETGTSVHVDDAFAGAALREITVEGACRQDGTPSPDNPVPIQVIEHPVVKVTGRNLLNPELVAVGASDIYSASGGMLTVKRRDGRAWATIDPSIALPAGTYCASGDYFEIRDELGNTVINGSGPFTLAMDSRLKVKVGMTARAYPYVSKAQIERGGTGSGYVPYTSQALAFTLPPEHPFLAKVADRSDEIVVDEDGSVELVARVGVDKDVRTVNTSVQGAYYSLKTKIPPYSSYGEFSSSHGSKIALCSAIPNTVSSESGEGIYRSWNSVLVKDTSGRTKEEIQAELDKNAPLTVVATMPEKRYQLGKIEMPKAQDNIVNAWTDAEVTPNTGIEYTRDVNVVVANLEAAIASIS